MITIGSYISLIGHTLCKAEMLNCNNLLLEIQLKCEAQLMHSAFWSIWKTVSDFKCDHRNWHTGVVFCITCFIVKNLYQKSHRIFFYGWARKKKFMRHRTSAPFPSSVGFLYHLVQQNNLQRVKYYSCILIVMENA